MVYFAVPLCVQPHCIFFSNKQRNASSLGSRVGIFFVLTGSFFREGAPGITLAQGVLPAFPHILTPPHFSCNVESG